ncbi:MAG: DUF5919 domain-containing protein [Ktedonobacteraceae bacterium]
MGWTQEKMAQKWSYSFETISAWERGKRSPGSQEIPRLAKLLEIEPEELAEIVINSREQPYIRKTHVAQYQETRTTWKTSFETWGELQRIYRTRTEFIRDFSYPRMFENAHSIIAVGISLNTVSMNYSRDDLIKSVFEEKCVFQLCFLDPNGKNCAEREEEESYPGGTLASLTSFNIHIMKAIRSQIEKIDPERCKQIEIKTYDMVPRYNIYIVDDTLMTVQGYGYGRGEDTPILVLKRATVNGLFDFYVSEAKHIFEHSIEISENPIIKK